MCTLQGLTAVCVDITLTHHNANPLPVSMVVAAPAGAAGAAAAAAPKRGRFSVQVVDTGAACTDAANASPRLSPIPPISDDGEVSPPGDGASSLNLASAPRFRQSVADR